MTEKPYLLLLSGLPASGKTTRARAWLAEKPDNRRRINYDDLRTELYGPEWRFNRREEDLMQAEANARAISAISEGKGVVIDNTNLTDKAKNRWRELAKSLGVSCYEEELDTPIAVCVARDRARAEGRVGRAVIERMALFTGWIDWGKDYPKIHSSGRDFIIVDVDGTLADTSHRQHYVVPHGVHKPYCANGDKELRPTQGKCPQCDIVLKKDWDRFFAACAEDPLMQPIADLVALLGLEYYIIVVSGRPIDQCGIATEDWLLKHNIHPLHLFMRNGPGDHRPDYEVKQEILDLLPKGRIAYVLDDRPQVLRMWRANGLTTLAVGDLKEF